MLVIYIYRHVGVELVENFLPSPCFLLHHQKLCKIVSQAQLLLVRLNIPIDKSNKLINKLYQTLWATDFPLDVKMPVKINLKFTRCNKEVFLPSELLSISFKLLHSAFCFCCISKNVKTFLNKDVTANNLVIFIKLNAWTKLSTFWVIGFGIITRGNPFSNGPNISKIESIKVKVV